MYEYIILGAGVTGITLCKKLREAGIDNVLVLEKESQWGGLCRTQVIDGHNLDIGGGHFFHTKHQEVFDYVFKYVPKEDFTYYPRVSKIEMEGQTIDYPIESNIWQLSMDKQISYLISVIRNRESQGYPAPDNYEDWIRWKLGDKICENYMIPYNEKLWGVQPSEMDVDWLYKIPRVNVEEVLQYSLTHKADVSKFPAHIHFYYPKQGGFQRIADALATDEKDKILLNTPVKKMVYKKDRWIINGEWEAKNVVTTIPWNDLQHCLDVPVELENSFARIKYNRIIISLYENEYKHNWHWRYIPDAQKAHHREFFIHNFSESSKEGGVYLETGIARRDFAGIPYEGRKIYETETDAAYPIPVIGHTAAINTILDYYKQYRLFGIGRWGQHEYQNADVSMYNAINFVEHLINNNETGCRHSPAGGNR